jgi:hypothetical protein
VRPRDLDDRFASSGPLGLVRDVPQLGVLLVVTVVLAGVLVARSSDEAQSARQRGNAGSAALGPAVGASIDEHFSTARERAVAVAATDPEARFTALVSLSDGRTPVQTPGDVVAASRSAGAEAAANGSGCSCVFAVVVEGPAGRLAGLTGSAGILGVELAARSARLSDLDVLPLPPDATGIVEAPAPTPRR